MCISNALRLKDTTFLFLLYCTKDFNTNLGGGALNRPVIDTIDDVMRILSVDGAADRLGCAENLLDAAGELAGHRPGPHGAGGLVDVVHGDVSAVLDVLDLLPVPGGLLEGLDDEGSGGGDHGALSLPVLNAELNSNFEALPVAGGLGDVISNLLGRQTKRTNLK